MEDPRGLKPVKRLIAATTCAFTGAAFLGLTIVGYVVPPEPEGGRIGRMVSGVLFVLTVVWCLWLYLDYRRELDHKKDKSP